MHLTPAVRTILIVTVAAYFLQMTMRGLLESLFILQPASLLVRPWTAVTYMLLHSTGGIMHLLGNMLGLFFFGPRVEERIGTRRFWWLYLISGVTGALLSLFTPTAYVLGASAGVFGVTLAFAYFWPDALIHIWGVLPVPAKYLVLGYGVLTIFGIRSGGGGVAHYAHLGGYLGAFLYLKWIERGKATFKKKAVAPPPAADKALSRWKAVDRTKVHEVNREELDRILDKISAQGLASLTPQERTFLAHFVPPDDRVPPVQ